MTYPDPRYPQQQPPPGPYSPPGYQAPQGYGYPPAGYPNPQQPYPPQPGYYQQPGYPQPYEYQQPQPGPQRNGNSAGWHAASILMTTLFRGTYGFGGDARNRVITALMCLGIGFVALVIIVLAGTYLR